MPRISLRDVLVAGGAGAFAVALLAGNVRHAGWYIAAAIFVGGLMIGLRSVAAVFAVSVLFAVGWVVWATIHPVRDVDGDARAYSLLIATILPALASVPAVAGAAVRWLYLKQRGEASPPRIPRAESPAAKLLVAIVGLGGMLVFGYWALLAALLFLLVSATRPRAL